MGTPASPRRARHFETVRQLCADGDSDRALGLLRRWLDGNPDDRRARLLLSETLLSAGQKDAALDELTQLASQYEEAGFVREALVVRERVVHLDSSRAEVRALAERARATMAPAPEPERAPPALPSPIPSFEDEQSAAAFSDALTDALDAAVSLTERLEWVVREREADLAAFDRKLATLRRSGSDVARATLVRLEDRRNDLEAEAEELRAGDASAAALLEALARLEDEHRAGVTQRLPEVQRMLEEKDATIEELEGLLELIGGDEVQPAVPDRRLFDVTVTRFLLGSDD